MGSLGRRNEKAQEGRRTKVMKKILDFRASCTFSRVGTEMGPHGGRKEGKTVGRTNIFERIL